ncbi:MAG: ATP-binding cassette domain-containing protein, partial [Clostridia bacterium]|nr:ATP-binding cassette domain-containing protein [Clostridia bacterium]
MNLLSIENLAKSYGERTLFKNVTLGIDEGDKIGLIGVNGTGKSTFLKIIAGLVNSDMGSITKGKSVQMEFLPQNPEFDAEATVLEQVFKGNSPVIRVLKEYQQVLEQIQKCPGNFVLEKKLISLSEKMEENQAWQLESDAKRILTKLGITDFMAKVSILSGGQRKRVALASTLINPADLLILDEPTNHIDNDTVAWLEQYLDKRKGALLMVTHDRYFLDRVTNRIIELDKGKLYSYAGNYSEFLELKIA